MKIINYIFYCTYRFVLKTPNKNNALDVAGVLTPYIFVMHGVAIYCTLLFFLNRRDLINGTSTSIMVFIFFALVAMSCFYYVIKKNDKKVLKQFNNLNNSSKPTWIGFFLFIETLLLGFIVAGLLILYTKIFRGEP